MASARLVLLSAILTVLVAALSPPEVSTGAALEHTGGALSLSAGRVTACSGGSLQDISRQLGIALRWLPLVVVLALVAGGVAYVWASGRPVVVEAVGTLRVDPGQNPSIQDRSDAVLAAVGYASEMEAPGFARAVIKRLGLDKTPPELLRRFSAQVDNGADIGIIQFGVQSTDPAEAQEIARAFGDVLIQRKANELYTADVKNATQQVNRLEGDLGSLRRTLQNLQNRNNKTEADRSAIAGLIGDIAALNLSIENLRPFTRPYVRNVPGWVIQPRTPSESVAAGPLYWTLLAVVVGAMAAIGLAFVMEYLRRLYKVREERDVELATGQPALGAVFEARADAKRLEQERLVMLHYPRSDEANAYRGLIARIGFTGGTVRTLMVASAGPTASKSLVAANLALAYAEAGRNVILVDADYRAPKIHTFFGLRNDRGLTTVLADSSVPLGWTTVPSPHPRLGLMLAGPLPPETAAPLGPRQLNALLRRLLQAADFVIFDSPPIVASLDASVLAEAVGETLLVIPRDSKESEVAEASQALHMVDAEFLGAVLYRKVRRSRKGARAKVPAAPEGWGPTWPTMNDQQATIPAFSRPGVRQPAPSPGVSHAGASSSRPPEAHTQMPRQPAPTQQDPYEQHGHDSGPMSTPGRAPAPGPFATPFDPRSAKHQPPAGTARPGLAPTSPTGQAPRPSTAPPVTGSSPSGPRVAIPVQSEPPQQPLDDPPEDERSSEELRTPVGASTPETAAG